MNYFFKFLLYTIISIVTFMLLKISLLSLITEEKYNSPILDLAHRGYADKHKESSIEAFIYAIKSKTDGLEFDLRQTLDKVVIINHDRVLNGMYIENTTFENLKQHNKVLTLKEILILVQKTNTKVWIEIKDSYLYPNIINNILDILEEESFENEVIIQSFNIDDLFYVNQKNQKIKLLKLFIYYNNGDIPNYIDYIGIPILYTIINPSSIDFLHKLGFKVILWRESSLFETNYILTKLILLGVDGFMINRPLNLILK